MNNRQIHTIHLHGTLSADAQGAVPMTAHVGATLLEVAACASNAGAATLALGIGGDSPDPDAIMTEKAIGQNGAPTIFTVANFDGILADPLRSSCPRFGPQDVLTWALNYNGVGMNAVQTVTITGAPTGGTFTLTFSGQTTAAIAYNATAAAVATALKALSNIGDNDVEVTGPAGGPWVVTFVGALAESSVAQMTKTPNLTGGTTPDVAIATQTAGAPLTAAANVDLVFTLLLGSANSGVSGLTP